MMKKARVFNIERCSTEDGPGIRTTVFLKGCPLRCKWCANPESQLYTKEVLFKAVQCIGCGKCVEVCPQNAIRNITGLGFITDTEKCSLCGKCIDTCVVNARIMQGEDLSTEELMSILERDEAYYIASGGGITFSGGEPLEYADFIAEAAEAIHKKNWTVLIETCGQVSLEKIKKASEFSDIIYCDLKHINSDRHTSLTGKDNDVILRNIVWLNENFRGKLHIRYPYIPSLNDGEKEIKEFLQFISKLKNVRDVTFLPYHRLGLPKYQGLGRKYEMDGIQPLKVSDLYFLKDYQNLYNIKISIQ
ncbi:MAG: glycyl-radical enzyme activating protein [Christensenella sp.]|nr:glycyl-radical enzyme activating protein [Christensenella sp.]